MLKKIYHLLIAFIVFSQTVSMAQVIDSLHTIPSELHIDYSSTPRRLTIADIAVTGIEGTMYENQAFVLVGFSGLAVGQQIMVPGEEITNAIRRFWRQGLFSNVGITQNKIEGDSIWLEIQLTDRPRIADIQFSGMRRNEQEDIERRVNFQRGVQITPPQISRAENIIRSYFAEKGFGDAQVNIVQRPDGSGLNQVILEVNVDKRERLRVNSITIEGNETLTSNQIQRAMKKTNQRGRLRNLFRPKRFVEELFVEDRARIIERYQSRGFRDAEIISYSVERHDDRTVNIHLVVNEGPIFHIRSINWVGNTQYPTAQLQRILNMVPGDVYNQTKLLERLITDEDAVVNLYQNNGFLFSNIEPVEINIENDSVDLELRVIEGPKATIRRVIIQGNDRLYEDVIRRELRTKPGAVFSKEDLIRSVREIAQTGHFDPEALQGSIGQGISPNPEDGTVDITFPLTSKGNDQIEFSAGWGVTGLVGKLGLKLNNFSLNNLLNPDMRRGGIIPQGEGQTLSISAQTNGRFFQSYQFSFIEPWLGGRRPNHLSFNLFYSRYTGLNSDYYSQNMFFNNPYMMGGMGMGGMGGGGMWQDMSQYAYDPNQVFNMFGASVGYGRRLNWPDDFFQLMGEVGWQRYGLKNWTWNQFPFQTGVSNSLTFGLTLSRRSTDSPIYTRLGSEFSLSVNATPPFSLLDGKDYANMAFNDPARFTWNEYHKWKFRGRTFTPLTSPIGGIKRTPVVATRVEFGMLGHYNLNKLSPFETFDMGGDGMSGFSTSFATENIALRGYENNSIATQARAYTRLGLELRYPFILEPNSTIYGVAFLEAGNAWMQVRDFNPFDLKRSAGVGARIFLPMIGLMGIDWAYGFDTVIGTGSRRRGGNQFHFVIGQEF
ncbi:MAG: outer membrane protein assembly factor BamA [Dysgonamonadaceae bacterium]|jgi:outer membrane protein insertion porin family|nr:outer membrane protein assembly factor BamA [Dysgonamonadaceae bacterium]